MGEEPLDELRQVELERIRSEISRNLAIERKLEAEQHKAETETLALKQSLSAPVYRRPENVKWIIWGAVSAGLFALWFIEYFEPIFTAEQQRSELEVQITQKRNEFQQLLNEETTRQLQGQIAEFRRQQDNHLRTIETVQAEKQQLAGEFAMLAKKQQLTEQERAEYAKQARKLEQNYFASQQEIEKLKNAQAQSKALESDLGISSGLFGSSGWGSTAWGGSRSSLSPSIGGEAIGGGTIAGYAGTSRLSLSSSLSGLHLKLITDLKTYDYWGLQALAEQHGAQVQVQRLVDASSIGFDPGVLYYGSQEDGELATALQGLAVFPYLTLSDTKPIKEVRRVLGISQPTLRLPERP